MIKKLRIKFVCINMAFVTVMLVFILFNIVQFTRQNMVQNSIQMMDRLSSNPLYLIRPNDYVNVSLPYFSLRINEKKELTELASNYYDLSDRAFLQQVINDTAQIPGRIGDLPQYRLRFMRIDAPAGHFLIFMDISHELDTLQTLTRNCILIGCFSFLIFLVISIFFANWAIRPVANAWSAQKQFIADASHELKTPLTVILTNAEMLQDSGCDEWNKTRFSENILTMATRMRGLVNGLLELSRLDNGALEKKTERVELSRLLQSCCLLFEPLFFEQGLLLESDTAPGLFVAGSQTHLKQLTEILLDNALKYAAPHTTVTVSLQLQKRQPLLKGLPPQLFRPAHKSCRLCVSSYGAPISEADLTNIFQRFYRADASRHNAASGHNDSNDIGSCSDTSSHNNSSYGLGLSIAKSIVYAHRGKIWAESADGLNSFYVTLPLIEA